MIGEIPALKKFYQSRWFEILALVLISALTYLPHIAELGYYRDDWYFLYGALVRGPQALIDVALHTRPIRGPLYALYFSLFGLNIFPYHVVMYLTRSLGGLAALWLFHLIWPKQRQANFFMAVLFVLFPGFLWWVSGFEFQPYVLSVGLQALSIAFTLKAIASDTMPKRLGWTIAALFSGWAYLALVEYAIGMEAFRLLCVYLFVRRRQANETFVSSVGQTLRTSSLHLLVPVVFLFWYQFLFDNWRNAQDAGTQLARLFTSPTTLIWRLIDVMRSFLNVSVFAWVIPFYQNFYSNRLSDIALGLVCATFVIGILFLVHKYSGPQEEAPTTQELLWLGLLGTLGGVLPVVLANRIVTFERISQYTLPASLTGVIFLGGLIYSVFPKHLRFMLLSGLVGLAVLSQHGLAAQAANEKQTVSDFWWQVAWRAPQIGSGATLVVIYPDLNYAEGSELAWGPANFLYAAEKQNQTPVFVPISASRLEPDSVLEIVNANREFEQTDVVIKNTSMVVDYKNQLIFSQPTNDACVHTLDPRWPDLSIHDQSFIHASARNSRLDNILVDAQSATPLRYAFGAEPVHNWCYYYQKADLARQTGDWQAIARLGHEAQKLGLHPNDQVEWMPFLQAYAFLGDQKQVKGLSTRINTEKFYRDQACRNLNAMSEFGYPLSAEMTSYVSDLFCK